MQRSQGSRVTRAFSCKSGVTMMTQMSCEVEADVFRDAYLRIQSHIESMKVQRDDILAWIREAQISYAAMKKATANKEATLNATEASLAERQRQLDQKSSIQIEKGKQMEALAIHKSMSAHVEILKDQLDQVYDELGRTMAQAVQGNGLENKIRLLKTVIAGLTKSVQERSQIVMDCERQLIPAAAAYAAVTKEEEEWIAAKAEKDAKIDELEEKRAEFVRILAEPIDTNEHEEQVVKTIEDSLAEAEQKLQETEVEKVEEEVNEQELNLERIEQENRRRAVMNDKRTLALEKRRIFMEWRGLCVESQLLQQREEIMELIEENNEKWRTVKLNDRPGEALTPELYAERISKLTQEKQENIDNIYRTNKEYDEKIKGSRKMIKEKWERKMRRIEGYSKRIARKDAIRLQIQQKADDNDELREKIQTLQHKIDQTKRRKEVWLRKQEAHSDANKISRENQERIQEKRAQLREKEKALLTKRPGIVEAAKEVEEMEQSVVALEMEVQELERQLAQYREPMEGAVENLHEGEQQLDEVIELRSPAKDRSLSVTSP